MNLHFTQQLSSSALRPKAAWLQQILVLEQTSSTNDDAWELAQSNAPLPAAIFAEVQTKGRGQHGRQWHTAPGKGLWFSVVLQPELSVKDAARLTFAAAVAVAHTIRKTTLLRAEIKPPNDILVNGQKTAGILVETRHLGQFTAVIGIGLNVHHTLSDFPLSLQETATSLDLAGADAIDRNHLASTLLSNLHHQLFQAYFKPTELYQDYKMLLNPAFEVPKIC